MHRAKASTLKTMSGFRYGVQANASKAQELQEHIGWETLSLEEALTSLERMLQLPSVEMLTCILHKCRENKNLTYTKRLHAYISTSGLENHTCLGNYLVPTLVLVGIICEAQQVFNRMANRNLYSWTSLIIGYIECGEPQCALDLYQKMQEDSVHPSKNTFIFLLKACSILKTLERGQEIHAQIARKGWEKDTFVGNILVHTYAKCGSIAKALEVFDRLLVQDVVSWTALISGYAEYGFGEEAVNGFRKMQLEGVSPNAFTFVCILKGCCSVGAIDKGQEIHAEVARRGLEKNHFVGNTLVDMYAKCGLLARASEVFDRLPVWNEVAWNALIAGYADQGLGEEVLNCLEQMQVGGISPNAVTIVFGLKACGSIGAIAKGRLIHAEIARKGLERNSFVGNTLVGMYARWGTLGKAQEAFDKLPVRDVVPWTALISGYAELNCFEQMQMEGVSPNAFTVVCSLQACGSIGAIEKGGETHAEIARNGVEGDFYVGSALVDMYAKCGSLAKACDVFDKLAIRGVVPWTAMIAGYAEHDLGEEALNFFENMKLEGISPNAFTFVCSLKACICICAIDKGRDLHAEIARRGLETDLFTGNALVDIYAKCGSLAVAREVFDKLPIRSKISWNTLIAGYAAQGLGEEALHCFEQMQLEGMFPNDFTYIWSLKACGNVRSIDKGREINAEVARKGLETDLFVGNALVDMYVKCGSLVKAQEAFDKMPIRDVVLWTALIAGYAEQGFGEEALNFFKQMQLEGIFPNVFTFVCCIKACGSVGAADKGGEIHTEIVRKGLEREEFVGNTLVDMYVKCGFLAEAREIFDKLPDRDVVSWTALIAGYAEHGLSEEALNCFEQMQVEGVALDALTFVYSLKACSSMGAIDKGREIHSHIARKGLERDPSVDNALMIMYAKCGLFAKAWEVFNIVPVRDAVRWTTLITGYAEHGLGEEALNCFEQMQMEGVCPDFSTFVCSLKACGSIRAIGKGQEIHAEIAKRGLEGDILVGNSLVDMYAKCGLFTRAREVFHKLPVRDVISWTALIAGYVEQGLGEQALNSFEHMQIEYIFPNAFTFVCILKACASIGATYKGRKIHADIARKGLESDIFVGNALVDMYAKCGLLAEAVEAFNNLQVRDEVSWNALVAGYAQLGENETVFCMLERMRKEGIKPDGVTFLLVLTVCSHTGLVDTGQIYFEAMSKVYDIIPTIEHHTCMVDLICRAGQLDEVVAMVKEMPFHPNLVMWHTVLGACRKWGNVELGRFAFEHAIQLDEKDASAYVLMSNIYVDTYIQKDEKWVEAMRLTEVSWKTPTARSVPWASSSPSTYSLPGS